MHAQDLPIYQCGQVEVVKHVHAIFPGVGIAVLAHALLVETVHLEGGEGKGGRNGKMDSEIIVPIYVHISHKKTASFPSLPPASPFTCVICRDS